MKGFHLSSGGGGGSVTTPLGAGATPLATQLSSTTAQPPAKKSSLTIASADIAIDMNMKKSAMQR